MCDQTEIKYLPNEIVWVKLGPVWWPGEVQDYNSLPEEITGNLRKQPIAIVKFFQEDSYEYIKNLNHIYRYNCLKKNEFIKKGLDMCRSGNSRDVPSNMKMFPDDIVTAEKKTGGDENILDSELFAPEKKKSYTDLFGTPKKPGKEGTGKRGRPSSSDIKPNIKNIHLSTSSSLPPQSSRSITHPRFTNRTQVNISDYESRVRHQPPADSETSSSSVYRCHSCDYTTVRLNVIVLHNKTHIGKNADFSSKESKITIKKSLPKIKSVSTPKIKQEATKRKSPTESPNVAKKANITQTAVKQPTEKSPAKPTPTPEVETKPVAKKRAGKSVKTEKLAKIMKENEAIRENLLKDWDDEDESAEEEEKSKNSDDKNFSFNSTFINDSNDWMSSENSQENQNKSLPSEKIDDDDMVVSSSTSDVKSNHKADTKPVSTEEEKSCFDFDESEETDPVTFSRKTPKAVSNESAVSTSENKNDEELIDFEKKIDDLLSETSVPALPGNLKLPNIDPGNLKLPNIDPDKPMLVNFEAPEPKTEPNKNEESVDSSKIENNSSEAANKISIENSDSSPLTSSCSNGNFSLKDFSVDTVPKESSDTAIPNSPEQLSSPKAPEQLSSPKAPEQLSSPKAPEQLSSPKAPEQLSSPKAPERLSSPPAPEPICPPRISGRRSSRRNSAAEKKQAVTKVEQKVATYTLKSIEDNESVLLDTEQKSDDKHPPSSSNSKSTSAKAVSNKDDKVTTPEEVSKPVDSEVVQPQKISNVLESQKIVEKRSEPFNTSSLSFDTLPVDHVAEVVAPVAQTDSTKEKPVKKGVKFQPKIIKPKSVSSKILSVTPSVEPEVKPLPPKVAETTESSSEVKIETPLINKLGSPTKAEVEPPSGETSTTAKSTEVSTTNESDNKPESLGFYETVADSNIEIEVAEEVLPCEPLDQLPEATSAEIKLPEIILPSESTNAVPEVSREEICFKESPVVSVDVTTEKMDFDEKSVMKTCDMNFDINSMPIIIDNSEYLPTSTSFEKLEPVTNILSSSTAEASSSLGTKKPETKVVKLKGTSFLEKALSNVDGGSIAASAKSTVKKTSVVSKEKASAPKTILPASGLSTKMRAIKLPSGSKFLTQNSKSSPNQVLLLKTSTGQQLIKSSQIVQQADGKMLIITSNQASRSGIVVKNVGKDAAAGSGKMTIPRVITAKGLVSSSSAEIEGVSSGKTVQNILTKSTVEGGMKSKVVTASLPTGAKKVVGKVTAVPSNNSVSLLAPQSNVQGKNVILANKQGNMSKVIITSKPSGSIGTKLVMHSSPTKVVLPASLQRKLGTSSTGPTNIIVQATRPTASAVPALVSSNSKVVATKAGATTTKVVRTTKPSPNILQKPIRKQAVKTVSVGPRSKVVPPAVTSVSSSLAPVPTDPVILPPTSVVASNPSSVAQQPVMYVAVDNNTYQAVDSSMLAYDGSQQPTQTLFINPGTTNLENILLTIDEKGNLNLAQQTPQLFTSDVATPTQDILAKALADTQVLQAEASIAETTDRVAYIESLPYPPPSLTNNVLETSLTLNQPIMTPLEVPSSATPLSSNFNLISSEQSVDAVKSPQDMFITQIPGVSGSNVAFQITVDENLVAASSAELGQVTSLANPISLSSESLENNIDEDLIKINKPVKPSNVNFVDNYESGSVAVTSVPEENLSGVETSSELPPSIVLTSESDNTNFASSKITTSEVVPLTQSDSVIDESQLQSVETIAKIDENLETSNETADKDKFLLPTEVTNGISVEPDSSGPEVSKEIIFSCQEEVVNSSDDV